jgi:pyruvate dehydrogenase E2 component (dihydrolipoamide acetyltransferase)
MPRQGQSVESCVIGQWLKKVGDKVAVGDELFTYETDKAIFDEAAKVDGEMLAIFFAEGDDVSCLTNVCVIGNPGEDISAFDPAAADTAKATASAVAAPTGQTASPESPSHRAHSPASPAPVSVSDLAISPRAKALAGKQNVDLRTVRPTGPKGRVIERDIVQLIDDGRFATGAAGTDYLPGITGTGIGGRVSVDNVVSQDNNIARNAEATIPPPAIGSFYEEKHSNIRKLIAKAMVQSLASMAQLTYNASFDATDIFQFRAKLKKARESGLADMIVLPENITINDIILYTVSRVVKNHPRCNAHYHDDRMVIFNNVNLGLAVDTPRGLMVPTIFNADQLSIGEISAQAKALSAACQKGTISPDQLKDGTITVTNLGALGIESFTPVINLPQTAILGVNCLRTDVRNVNGVAVPYPSMSLSLTCDHRAIDGAPAARLLRDLTGALENFSLLLLK